MRVFMLGWEFPPFITGGLGTACAGLTKALSAMGVRITFVLPKPIDGEYTDHVRLLSPQSPEAAHGRREPEDVASGFMLDPYLPLGGTSGPQEPEPFSNVEFKAVPALIRDPYAHRVEASDAAEPAPVSGRPASGNPGRGNGQAMASTVADAPWARLAPDLLAEVRRYAALCLALTGQGSRLDDFDLIHAHDWMTLPAAMAISAVSGKPFIAHIHSTEFDRADEERGPDQAICDIERRGLNLASHVVTVSRRTRDLIVQRYAVPPERVSVIYNGLDNQSPECRKPSTRPNPWKGTGAGTGTDPVSADAHRYVLFLGRVTHQKGPERFVEAARLVASRRPEAVFVMAGAGDRLDAVRQRVAEAGLSDRFVFTGFLRGEEVADAMAAADVFVMPSVHEPFGIAALEAIHHETPVILSKDAGVAEVVHHALRCDVSDPVQLAELIVATLERPPLSQTLRENAAREVRGLTWHRSAERLLDAYRDLLARA